MSSTSGHLVNGDSIQFEYSNNDNSDDGDHTLNDRAHTTSKKKKKKKKSKAKGVSASIPSVNVIGSELNFDDPDFEYPDSRILKQNSNGDVIVQSLEPPKKSNPSSHTPPNSVYAQAAPKSSGNGLLPEDPEELNEELKKYWQSLSVQEKKELLNLERDSVFKVMKDQQKITCNCSVCGRKRQIIEAELKKLYDTYFEGIDAHELVAAELFNLNDALRKTPRQVKPNAPHLQNTAQKDSRNALSIGYQDLSPGQSNGVAASATLPVNARKNGIMSVAEDLLQNDGRKFLEMMEKLAESRIQRQSQYLKRRDLMVNNSNQIDEEENHDYMNSGSIDDDDDHEQSGLHLPSLQQATPQRQQLSISDLNFEVGYNEESDLDYEVDETDIDDLEYEEFWSDGENEMSKDDYLLLIEESKEIMNEDVANLTGDPQQMIDIQLKRQQQLHQQLQRERHELEQLQEEFLDGYEGHEVDEDDEEDDEGSYEDEEDGEFEHHHSHTHTCGHDHSHSHSHSHGTQDSQDREINAATIKELLTDELLHSEGEEEEEEYEEYSDEAIDEEQQLEEGRAMLQLCTTKMLRQSLLESFKKKKQEELVSALLEELDEEKVREKQREEKKQREKEKKREKKRLIQQQKEEERLKKEAEKERLKREKEEENRRKLEEGRRRKQEQERQKLEEKRRREEEQERARKEKEEKKRLKEEAKRLKEEELKIAEENAKRLKEEAERQASENERLLSEEEQSRFEQETFRQQQEMEASLLQQKIALEEEDRSRMQETLRSSTLPNPAEFKSHDRPSSHPSYDQFNSQASVNPLLDSVFQDSSYLGSPLVKASLLQNQTTQSQQLSAPTFGIENQLSQFNPHQHGSIPQSQTAFYTPRLSDPAFSHPTQDGSSSSPWTSNKPSLYNPLAALDNNSMNLAAQSRGSLSSVPAQTLVGGPPTTAGTPIAPLSSQNGFPNSAANDIDFISSSLANTSIGQFNNGILASSKVWSTNPVSTRSSWSHLPAANGWGETAIDASQPGSFTQHKTQPALNPSQSQQQPSMSGLGGIQLQQSAPPSMQTNANVDQLIKNYQTQILTTYSFSQSSHLEGGYMPVEELYSSFNSLQPPSQSVNFVLFLSILQSVSNRYTAEFIKDDVGNIKFVKLITSATPSNLNSRPASFNMNPLVGGVVPESSSLFKNEVFGGFDQSLNGGLTWGSSF